MSMVEGLGDEVLVAAGVTLMAAITSLAWITSRVNNNAAPVNRATTTPAASTRATLDVTRSPTTTTTTATASDIGDLTVSNEAALVVDPDDQEVANGSDNNNVMLNEEVPNAVANSSDSSIITIRLRFLDDRQREVQADLNDTIGVFKGRHFSTELSSAQSVRLIFNGRLLGNDNQTLGQHNVENNSVIHCLLSDLPASGPVTNGQDESEESESFDLAHLCFPLFGSLLIILWWCQLVHVNYFSTMASAALISLTIIYSIAFYTTYAL